MTHRRLWWLDADKDRPDDVLARRRPQPTEPEDTVAHARIAQISDLAAEARNGAYADLAAKLARARQAVLDLDAENANLRRQIGADEASLKFVKEVEVDPRQLCVLQGLLYGLHATDKEIVLTVRFTQSGDPMLRVHYRVDANESPREGWMIDEPPPDLAA